MRMRVEDWLSNPRSTVVIGLATFALTLFVVAMAGLTIPGLRADTSANRRSDNLRSCTAEFRSGIDRATDRVYTAFGDVQTISASATVGRQDMFAQQEYQAALTPALEELDAALTEFSDATTAYDEANQMSREDPDTFLANCVGADT